MEGVFETMTEENNLRIRANISETAKGLLQRDITIEILGTDKVSVSDPNDVLKIINKSLAVALFDKFQEIATEGKKRGYVFVGEELDKQ